MAWSGFQGLSGFSRFSCTLVLLRIRNENTFLVIIPVNLLLRSWQYGIGSQASSDEGADSKQASEPAAGQIEGKDQLGGSLETHSTVPANPDVATVPQSNTAAAPDIESKELASLSKTESSLTTPNARCERAKVTVSKYAFADIEPISCTGDVYRFSASGRETNSWLKSVLSTVSCWKSRN
jgi:hypothetical protein